MGRFGSLAAIFITADLGYGSELVW